MTTSKSNGERNEKSSAAEIDDILKTTGKESGGGFVVVDVSRPENGEMKNRNDD